MDLVIFVGFCKPDMAAVYAIENKNKRPNVRYYF